MHAQELISKSAPLGYHLGGLKYANAHQCYQSSLPPSSSLADGGVAAGLPRNTALALAAKTMAGAAAMVLESGAGSLTHPGVLKDKVASPGGTTIAGLMELESSGVRGAVMRAVKAAAIRSEELG